MIYYKIEKVIIKIKKNEIRTDAAGIGFIT